MHASYYKKWCAIAGEKINMLTPKNMVLKETSQGGYMPYWNCLCDCGKTKEIRVYNLVGQSPQISCGCMQLVSNKKHGMCDTKIYYLWRNTLRKNKNVDTKWKSFDNFYKDMKDGYREGMYLWRKDEESPFNKDNCIWGEGVGPTTKRILSKKLTGKKHTKEHRENNLKSLLSTLEKKKKLKKTNLPTL